MSRTGGGSLAERLLRRFEYSPAQRAQAVLESKASEPSSSKYSRTSAGMRPPAGSQSGSRQIQGASAGESEAPSVAVAASGQSRALSRFTQALVITGCRQ